MRRLPAYFDNPDLNTLLELQNSSYSTQPHSIIAKYALVAGEKYQSS